MSSQPLIVIDPLPRRLDDICEPDVRRRLEALGRLVVSEDRPMPSDELDRLLPEAALLIGQSDMPRARVEAARNLKAIFNVETNFLPNVDYQACQERGVWVLSPTSAFAGVVAESAVAMAIDLARGIGAADRAFRAGQERYGLAANAGCFQFSGAPVGLIGFGDLGRAVRSLLVPFRNPVKVYDPWLPPELVREHGCQPASLEEVLRTSRVVFVLASVTTTNQGFLGRAELALLQDGAVFLLLSRAAVVDFPELVRELKSGRLRAAIDVFPQEPVPKDDPIRTAGEGVLFSAHRTGGMPEALHLIGRLMVADAELVLQGLSPAMCRRADPALAGRLRSRPVSKT